MIRQITGFHQDDAGDWVAQLTCLHNQHVRHDPPFREREWVLSEGSRRERLGSPIDCPLCDRPELPNDLRLKRTAGPFDIGSLPEGLRREHRVADGTWGLLRILNGTVVFEMSTEPPISVTLRTGDSQPIPPGVDHVVRLDPEARIEVDFLAT